MSLISSGFVFYLFLAFLLFQLVPKKYRPAAVLAISYIFYLLASGLLSLLLLVATTLFDYFIGIQLSGEKSFAFRRFLLALSITMNLGLVVWNLSDLSTLAVLGLSYFTFLKLAYVIDVYAERIEPARNVILFASTVSFFPTITSGPIERVQHLLPQLAAKPVLLGDNLLSGAKRAVWGAFKKIVVANVLAVYVNMVYDEPHSYSGSALIIALVFYSFQIYADFSGYTDISLGVAQMMGIELFENFRGPYIAQSSLEFWRKWHVSLTNWIRSYVFFPLTRRLLQFTGRSHQRLVQIIVYMVTMTLVGCWHGFDGTFVVWGALHGIWLSISATTKPWFDRKLTTHLSVIRIFGTFLVVTLLWVFFRARSLSDALYIFSHMLRFNSPFLAVDVSDFPIRVGYYFIISTVGIVLMMLDNYLNSEYAGEHWRFQSLPLIFRWIAYYMMIFSIFVASLLAVGSNQFIYFQF